MQPVGDLAGGSFGGRGPQALDSGALARVRVPTIATSVDGMAQADRRDSAHAAKTAAQIGSDVAAGAPASRLSSDASRLFQDLQGQHISLPDASSMMTSLSRAKDVLNTSPAYAQGDIIPAEQSEAEGQIARVLDMVELAMRAPRS